MRARSVDRLLRRGNAEVLHAAHVARLALEIFDQTHALHQLTATEREWLQYGALLHDIGCYIGYSKHQRHSYYLITHGDLTGFSADEIEVSRRSRGTTRAAARRSTHENWRRLNPYLRAVVEKLAAILRIADGLDRSHRQIVTGVSCRVKARKHRARRGRAGRLRARARRRAQEGEPVRARVRPLGRAAGGSRRQRRGRAPEGPRDSLRRSAVELRNRRATRRRTVKEHFSEQLEDLRRQLILMGGEVERQIHRSIEALTEMDAEKARAVIAADEDIDRMEMPSRSPRSRCSPCSSRSPSTCAS